MLHQKKNYLDKALILIRQIPKMVRNANKETKILRTENKLLEGILINIGLENFIKMKT